MRIAAWLVAALVVAGLASVAWRGILIESDTMRIRSPIVDDSRPWRRTDCVYLTWRGIVRLTGEPQLVSETAAPGAKPTCRLFLRQANTSANGTAAPPLSRGDGRRRLLPVRPRRTPLQIT